MSELNKSIEHINSDSNQYIRKKIEVSSNEKLKDSKEYLTIIIPTFNENKNIIPLLKKLINLSQEWNIEILVIDDDSPDRTAEIVKDFSHLEPRVRLIQRIGRSGLASAIKEGIFTSKNNLIGVMDADGQHECETIYNAAKKLKDENLDMVIGSRFNKESNINGLSKNRTIGSSFANKIARFSLSKKYINITDYMSGCMVLNQSKTIDFIKKVDINGYKFLYELLAISKGKLNVKEIPLNFKPRIYGQSKFDLPIIWDFVLSVIHSLMCRIIPRRAISFGLVGSSGIVVQLLSTSILMSSVKFPFEKAIIFGALIAASSNYLINNMLTFRSFKLKNLKLIRGLIKFLIVSSLPIIANVGLATTYYNNISESTFWAQIAGIIVVFIWNYAASSRFVWNTP